MPNSIYRTACLFEHENKCNHAIAKGNEGGCSNCKLFKKNYNTERSNYEKRENE